MISVATVAALLLVLAVAGRGLLRGLGAPLPPDLAGRALLYPLSGLLALHLTLLALDLLSIPWTLATTGLPLGLLALGMLRPAGASCERGRTSPFGWGDAVALGAILVLAVAAAQRWSVHADFVYHWGLKGERFYLASGVDYELLHQPWNAYLHPDYPQLLPGLYAVTAMVRGGWDEAAMLLWSPLMVLGIVLGGRSALAAAGASRWAVQATTAALGASLAMIGVGYRLSGGADWLIALALAGSAAALLSASSAGGQRTTLAVAAAVGAGAKVEGVVLAAVLLSVAWLTGRRSPGSPSAPGWLLLALPAAGVVVPWLVQNQRHHLVSQPQLGAPSLHRGGEVLTALGQALTAPEWHGVGLLVLVLPLLAAARAARPLALAACGQLGFYLLVYLATRQGVGYYVLASFPRLAAHLLPAVVLAGSVVLDRWAHPAEPMPAAAR